MFCTFHARHSVEDIHVLSFKAENARAVVFLEVFVKVEGVKHKSGHKLMDLFFSGSRKCSEYLIADANEENISLTSLEFQHLPVCTFGSLIA